MLTMVHSNYARVKNGILQVDRKFITGMRRYAELIDAPLLTIHPEMPAGSQIMDLVEVPCKDLGFQVVTIKDYKCAESKALLRQQIARSSLVYGGGLGCAQIARSLGIPYILVLEYDRQTELTMTTMQVPSLLRRGIRSLRYLKYYLSDGIPSMRGARALHCNGYPIYDESRRFNEHRLLYLDSRMSADMVIGAGQLDERLRRRGGRPLRLLFSGRYECVKGADDSVRVAIECLRRGFNIELHTYGQGKLREQMRQLAGQSPVAGRIHIHDAIPYPELVQRSREFDLFVCCHIQNDPSCTYLETFGAGLPIVGYDNRMWQRLSAVSQCGYASPSGQPAAVASDIARLLADANLLADMSRRARAFALEHTFEREFSLRTAALQQELASARPMRSVA